MVTSHTVSAAPAPSAEHKRFCITFHDGRRLTMAAPNAEAAEARARRQHAGFVRTVKFLGKTKS